MTDFPVWLRKSGLFQPLSRRGKFSWTGQRRIERRAESGQYRRKAQPLWRHLDYVLLLSATAISALGAIMILSSTRGTDPDSYDLSYLRRQLLFIGIGVATMILVAAIDYRRLKTWFSLPFGAIVVLLVVVLTPLGTERRGTQAWFQLGAFQLQPAEIAKIGAIIAVAALLSRAEPPLDARWVAAALGLFGLPMGLILLQPDVGTAIVFVAIIMGMLLVGGAKLRHLVVLTAVGVIGVIGVFNSDMLESYQRDRLTSFVEPDEGLADESYNRNNSMIAIGSGGTNGKGVFEGDQTRLGNVPEQHTDFIFTALGEEMGFLGAAGLLALFWLLCWRTWRVAQLARDRLGALLCAGALAMLVFQVFQNVGMTMGIMPITGIPLPLMSYGGSSTLASWAAVGLVLNVGMRRGRN